MRSQRSILAVRYTPVSVAGGVRKAVGGFVRYVQHRDQHLEPDTARPVDAYVRYMAHRDRTSPGGRVFAKDDELDRRRFVDYITRSTQGLQPKWVVTRDGKRVDQQRAVYTFILSPEDWRGLDLRSLARTAMQQLEVDTAPSGIGPWFAAEHRNTAHHHVHIVLAARREVAPGRYSTLVVTRARLQRMKDAIALDIERTRDLERGSRSEKTTPPQRSDSQPSTPIVRFEHPARRRRRWIGDGVVWNRVIRPRFIRRPSHHPVSSTLRHLRAVARSYQRRMDWELERELAHHNREGWTR